MVRVRLAPEDAVSVRFAISPLIELAYSTRVLSASSSHTAHLTWSKQVRPALAHLDLRAFRALHQAPAYTPDFIHPPPMSPQPDLEGELDRMAATPVGQVRAEVLRAYEGHGSLPAVLQPFVEDTRDAVLNLQRVLREYWRLAIAPYWPRIRDVLDSDIFYRARQVADGGARGALSDIHPRVGWQGGDLTIDKPAECQFTLRGRGLLLVPSAFIWPGLGVISDAQWQPTVIYGVRGINLLWDPAADPPPKALTAVVGGTRAAMLGALATPRTTADLARSLELTAGAVSQHVTILRNAGLLTSHRTGRVVRHLRSDAGEHLVMASGRARDALAAEPSMRNGR